MPAPSSVDALLVLSFGGPEGPEDVLPFLENVLRGRPVPRERMLAVAERYQRRGGVSPIQEQNRALVAGVRQELEAAGIGLPVYWGNRNWHPLLPDTLRQMRDDGVRHAAVFVTAAYSSYSSCRQYLGNLDEARAAIGAGAPALTKLRVYFDHPGFVEPLADALADARRRAGPQAPVLFSGHSIPCAMAARSAYEAQLRQTAELVAARAGNPAWQLVFQSRSGPPGQPWLEPDIRDAIAFLPASTPAVVVAPIGFVSDHMEVVYDLDVEAAAAARARGTELVRAATPGRDPRFAAMVRELLCEHLDAGAAVRTLGGGGPWPSPCRAGCCPPGSPIDPGSGSTGGRPL
jgi:ferrochelatase